MTQNSPRFEEKKKSILFEGITVMWDKGYHATSVNDIVKAADVPKGSFYFYFKSKEDFAVQALQAYFDMIHAEEQLVLFAEGVPPMQRLKNFHNYRIEKALEEFKSDFKGCLACNFSSEIAQQIPAVQAVLQSFYDTILQDLITVGKEAQEAGSLSSDIDVAHLFAFIEDAGKGAMLSIKAMNSLEPINYYQYMLNHLLR